MKKIVFLITLAICTFLASTACYAASSRLDGKAVKNAKRGTELTGSNIEINIAKNEASLLKDKITITLDGAEWTGISSSGKIDADTSYELVEANKMKLSINVNDTIIEKGCKIIVPVSCTVTRQQKSINAVVNYGYEDIKNTELGIAACDYTRAYLDGGIREHKTGDNIYIKGDSSKYNKLKIKVVGDDVDKTRDKIKIKLIGAKWTDYKDSGKVSISNGSGANFKKVDESTLEIYFDEFPPSMRGTGYTLTLPLTGTITGTGEIKAEVDFGTDDIEKSTVAFARCVDGGLSVSSENPSSPVEYCNKIGNIVINDSSTQGFRAGTKINLSLNQTFKFAELPRLECREKFKDKCKVELSSAQSCVITITSAVESGNTGTITLVSPIIERDKNLKSSFSDVTITMKAEGWEKYENTAKIAEYSQGATIKPPIQITANLKNKVNKYGGLSAITLTDVSDRSYQAGDKLILTFDNGYYWFTKGKKPNLKLKGKFEEKCEFQFNDENPNEAYIVFKGKAEGTNGTIVIENVVIERDGTDSFEYVSLTVREADDSSNTATVPVAGFSSLSSYVPVTTTTKATTEAATEATTAELNIAKLKIGDVNYTVNGETKALLAPPYIKEGYTMLPMRALANIIGINDDNISYENKTAIFKLGNNTELSVKAGSSEYIIGGKTVALLAGAEIVNGTMFLPMRDLANAMGINNDSILFDPDTKEVTIKVN